MSTKTFFVTARHSRFPGRIDFPRNFSAQNFLSVEKSSIGSHPKRVFPDSQAKRSHPRGVNVRSKFTILFLLLQFFRRFFSLQASYRAETLTAERSRRPGFCENNEKILKNRNNLKNSRKFQKFSRNFRKLFAIAVGSGNLL